MSTIVDGVKVYNQQEQYVAYTRGFRDGACVTAMRKDHEGIAAYARGYGHGRAARAVHVTAFCKEIGYEPSVLRLAGEEEARDDTKDLVDGPNETPLSDRAHKLRWLVLQRGTCEAVKLDGTPCKLTRGLGWVSGAGIPDGPRYLCPGHWRSPPKRYKRRPRVGFVDARRA